MANDLRSLIRLHEWHVDQKRRELGQLLQQVADLEAQARDLERDLKAELTAASGDPMEGGFLFGNYSRRVITQREELAQSLVNAEDAMIVVRDALRDAHRELKKYEIVKENRDLEEARELDRKEQIVLDELGVQAYRQRRRG